ncbi:NAD-dependent epimerase/dehydratase family protein [Paenibacillus sp. MCAF20]
MSTGSKENVTIKHKGYSLSIEDPKCEEVFRSNRFDVVVHLAAQVNVGASIKNPRQDSESNVLGLVNMLTLSSKYKVKKFIFASSAAVYGTNDRVPLLETEVCDPISPYGISKWVGESYCTKWNELYDLETICFRFSNVYGPRQGGLGEGGVISIFTDRILAGQPLYVHGDGSQTRDFIYVEDVAYALFRASNSYLTGIYNLSTNTECSINTLIDKFGELQEIKSVNYSDSRPGDIKRSTLSNEKVKRDLDWTPMFDMDEGLNRTYSWFLQHRSTIESAASAVAEPSRAKLAFKSFMPYGENLLAFILTAWITINQPYSSFGSIDIKLFYITIMGIMYGSRQSMLAVLMSIGLFVFEKLYDGRELVSLFYNPDYLFQIAIYVFVGLVVGYAMERKNGKLQTQEQKIEELEGRYEFLNSVYSEVREVKDELQQRILNTGDSFGKMYAITKELESLEPEQVFMATVNVVKSIMGVQTVSIYTVNTTQSYLRLAAHSNGLEAGVSKSLRADEHPYLETVFASGKVFVNKELASGVPLMTAPVQGRGTIAAIISIDGMTFDKFSLYHQNLFKITADLVSSALSRAIAYTEASEGQRYVEGTTILKPDVFESILESKQQAWKKYNIPYLLLKGHLDGVSLIQYSTQLASLLRENDYIGLNKAGDVIVLLSNSGAEDAENVLSRFSHHRLMLNRFEGEIADV